MTTPSRLALLLAASSVGTGLASASPQAPSDYRVLVCSGDVFAYEGFTWTVSTIGMEIDPTGGWVSPVTATCPDTTPTFAKFIFGALPGTDPGDAELLFGPTISQGVVTQDLATATMVDGNIGLVADTGPVESALLNGTILLSEGSFLPATGETVHRIDWIQATSTPGVAYVYGMVENSVGEVRRALLRFPGTELLLGDGDTVPNYPATVRRLGDGLQVSPSGEHWSIEVSFSGLGGGAPTQGIVSDGQALDLGGGALMIVGQPVPSYLNAPVAGSAWSLVLKHFINDSGEWTVRGGVPSLGLVHIRSGRAVHVETTTPNHNPTSMGSDGFLCTDLGFDSRAEALPYLDLPATLDRDGDGLGDPGFTWPAGRFGSFGGTNDERLSLFRLSIDTPTSAKSALIMAPSYRVDRPLCAGVTNSTGRPGGLAAVGRADVDENWLTLTAWDLPTDAFGYFLVSKTPGFVMQPGGSVGNLCLSGSIGRAVDQIFTVPTSGRALAQLDLTALPQPQSSVPAQAGETWYAQAWHRDTVAGAALSNFTAAVRVDFD